MRRAGDKHALLSTLAGFLVGGVAVYLRTHSLAGESTMVVLIFLGGVLVRGENIVDLVRSWRKNGRETPPPQPRMEE